MSLEPKQRKTQIVVVIAFFTMVVELTVGHMSGSMALVVEGWHMATHVGALGAASLAYWYAQKNKGNKNFTSGTDKILHLVGYTSALLLILVTVHLTYESVTRLFHPHVIIYKQAAPVACIGLIVNLISAKILYHKDSPHSPTGQHVHQDHNIRSAYFHVLADVLTSILALIALGGGYFWGLSWLDPLFGILSGLIILKWALSLSLASGRDLIDYKQL